MKSFFSLVSVSLHTLLLFILIANAQARSNIDVTDDEISFPDNADSVKVRLKAGRGWDFRYTVPIDANGELSFRKLPLAIDVASATIESDRQIRCFLWRHGDMQQSRTRDKETVELMSSTFSPVEEFSGPFAQTERVYCYDESRDRKADSAFTIFIENRRGQTELVRVQAPNGSNEGSAPMTLVAAAGKGEERADFAELDMVAEYPTLGVDIAKAMIVAYSGDNVSQVEEALQNCLLFTSDKTDPEVVWPNVVTTLTPRSNLVKIRCFSQGHQASTTF